MVPSPKLHLPFPAIALSIAVLTLVSCGKKEDAPPATAAPAAAEGTPAAPAEAKKAPPAAEVAKDLPPPQASTGPFELTVDQPAYTVGSRQHVTVRTPESGWLYVGSMNADGAVYLYYPNPSMPSSKVFKDRTIKLPPVGGLRREEIWDINITLPEGINQGREIVFAFLSKTPLEGLKLDWGVDQREALTKAGWLASHAKPGLPGAECFPSGADHQTAWREYDIVRADPAVTPQ